MKKCIYVIRINDWFPELCAITLPLIQRWAERIGSELKIISKPKFPSWPPNYERMQVWELGRAYDWNVCMDVDYIVHPDKLEDPMEGRNPAVVYFETQTSADAFFNPHPYFLRDGRRVGVADSFISASSMVHDIWTPLDMPFEEAKTYCKGQERHVSELCFSMNLARYGLKYNGCIQDRSNFFHIGSTGDNKTKEQVIMIAKQKMHEMGITT